MFRKVDPNSPEGKWKSLGKDIDSGVLQSKRLNRTPEATFRGGWFRVSTGLFRDGTIPVDTNPHYIRTIFEISALDEETTQIGFIALNDGTFRMKKRQFAVVAGRTTETGFQTHEELGLTIAAFTDFDPQRQRAIASSAGHVAHEALMMYVRVKPDDMP